MTSYFNYFSVLLIIASILIADLKDSMRVKQAESEYLSLLSKADKVDLIYTNWAVFYSKYSKERISPMLKTISDYKEGK